MKKTIKIPIIATIAVLLIASSAWAIPVYDGQTYADYGVGRSGIPVLPTDSGYYIWSNDDANDEAKKSWSVRWTGNNNKDRATWSHWFGCVQLDSLELETTTKVLFEKRHPDRIRVSDDVIKFKGYAGPHFDGFDFTVNGEADYKIKFKLGNTLWSFDQSEENSQRGMDIYIGQGSDRPDVSLQKKRWRGDEYIVQTFEIAVPTSKDSLTAAISPFAVPEPDTMMLLGAGLIGMAAIGRRKVFKNRKS